MRLVRTQLLGPAGVFHSPVRLKLTKPKKSPSAVNAQRQRARKKMLAESGGKVFTRCCWCSKVIVIHNNIDPRLLIDHQPGDTVHHKIKVMLDGKETEFPIATVDHLVPIDEGGSNRLSNLDWSCEKCNQTRS